MTYSVLPAWPLLLFGIIEPVLLVWAWITNFKDPATYYISQYPTGTALTTPFPPQALSLSLQMGNVLLLLAFMAVICSWTAHSDISKKYLVAVAVADFGHIYAAYVSLGDELFWDVSKWNDMAWGNIGASVFLNVNRWATVLGLFGTVGGRRAVAGKKDK
jgi:hypothetical protein